MYPSSPGGDDFLPTPPEIGMKSLSLLPAPLPIVEPLCYLAEELNGQAISKDGNLIDVVSTLDSHLQKTRLDNSRGLIFGESIE